MVQLLVLPEAVYDQYKVDGVQFNRLLDTNYIACPDVSSVNDLAQIDIALNEFPFVFCPGTGIVLAHSPRVGIAIASTSDVENKFMMQDLHNALEERVETLSLRLANQPKLVSEYSLYPVDENLWVAVQKSLPITNSDPERLTLISNRTFFDSLIYELLRTCKLSQVASTNLFNYYLMSKV
ncbi:virion structural protein [Pseudomonas phage 201phi2-1]|uniref:Virion structural protein n=1 Tax=Pseudomonas phage 201phi2-1 TaxID=198110 RepID=B3FJ61_BP201|nr:virion structural protein [Pseudomonas phage 201phi2-1]ABY63028.1 virion structural protein [Pseudomonas phage 201phi2-1]